MKMSFVRHPEELKLTGNVEENWKYFKQSFELYALAVGLEADERRKIALLLTVAGRGALEVYNTFVFSEEEKNNYDAVIAQFDHYCTPKINETFERYVFRTRMQGETESIDEYVADLRLKSRWCNFGTLCDSIIKDQLVFGIRDNVVRAHLLKERDLSLEKAVIICQAFEKAIVQIKTLGRQRGTAEVDTTKAVPVKNDHKRSRECQSCERCGCKHSPGQCPALGHECRRCGTKHHPSISCPFKEKEHKQSDSEDEDTSVYMVTIEDEYGTSEEEWVTHLEENGADVPLKVEPAIRAECSQRLEYKSKDLLLLTQPQTLEQKNSSMGLVKREAFCEMLAATSSPQVDCPSPHGISVSRKWKRNNSQDPSLPYVKKPPNAFMLYMKEQRPSVVAELVWSDNALVNRILGQRWKSLSSREQAKYYEEAEKMKKLHAEKYPWWSARDNYGKKKKRIRRKYHPGFEEYDHAVQLGAEPGTFNGTDQYRLVMPSTDSR